MEIKRKLHILADAAKYDASCASSGSFRKRPKDGIGDTNGVGICHSYTPDGRCVSLLKILLTNFCIFDCLYCINRISSNVPRARFTIQEVVSLTLNFYRRNYIEGLFLSSGIIDSSDYTMEQLIEVAKSLRTEHQFGGYIHLKGIPGASDRLLKEAGIYADRLSLNIELPSQEALNQVAPAKKLIEIEDSMSLVKTEHDASCVQSYKGKYSVDKHNSPVKRKEKGSLYLPAGQSTQIIVGASEGGDRKVLEKASFLYTKHKLRRVYYSAFSPTQSVSPLLPDKPIPLLREHRLYQADWLIRFYGFSASEITTEAEPDLPLDLDPKVAWALRNRHFFPIDINKASFHQLVRVPGIGTRGALKIINSRRFQKLELSMLPKLGVSIKKAQYFVVAGNNTGSVNKLDSENLILLFKPRPEYKQLSLFPTEDSISREQQSFNEAVTGEL